MSGQQGGRISNAELRGMIEPRGRSSAFRSIRLIAAALVIAVPAASVFAWRSGTLAAHWPASIAMPAFLGGKSGPPAPTPVADAQRALVMGGKGIGASASRPSSAPARLTQPRQLGVSDLERAARPAGFQPPPATTLDRYADQARSGAAHLKDRAASLPLAATSDVHRALMDGQLTGAANPNSAEGRCLSRQAQANIGRRDAVIRSLDDHAVQISCLATLAPQRLCAAGTKSLLVAHVGRYLERMQLRPTGWKAQVAASPEGKALLAGGVHRALRDDLRRAAAQGTIRTADFGVIAPRFIMETIGDVQRTGTACAGA